MSLSLSLFDVACQYAISETVLPCNCDPCIVIKHSCSLNHNQNSDIGFSNDIVSLPYKTMHVHGWMIHFPSYPLFLLLSPHSNLRTLTHCRALSLWLQRSFMLRHDFCARFKSELFLSWSMCYILVHHECLSVRELYSLHACGYVLPLPMHLGIGGPVSQLLNLLRISHVHNQCMIIDHPDYHIDSTVEVNVGGGRAHLFSYNDIMPHAIHSGHVCGQEVMFNYVDHGHMPSLSHVSTRSEEFVLAKVPLVNIVQHISIAASLKIARQHNMDIGSHVPKTQLLSYFDNHHCPNCDDYVTVFSAKTAQMTATVRSRGHRNTVEKESTNKDTTMNNFPPIPLSTELTETIISDFCVAMKPETFQEGGCAVCGQLTTLAQLSPLKHMKGMLSVLECKDATRVERRASTDPIRNFRGPVVDHECKKICVACRASIRKGNVPNNALAKGLWLGNVPPVLSELRFVEKLLIARLRHNCCFIRVASGLRKMTSHIVAFQAPIPKLYHALPPPIEDLDEVLAVLFTGPAKPTQKDFERTPLLVRRNAVSKALNWLKLNHADYKDIEISYENLAQYPEDNPPVTIEFRHSEVNKYPENTSVFDHEEEDGTQDGECPFVVHGLTGEHINTMTSSKLKGIALTYLNNGGKMLAVGHSSELVSIYNNPQYYPQMFPWLFPYGLGGVGSTHLSDAMHKRFLLMYHDKRFQKDVYFPFVAFSHSQIKSCASGAYLLAERKKFGEITNRILSLDQDILADIAKRMSVGELVKPQTDAEKDCFQVIRDLDLIAQHVDGSVTSKKYMRSEIWSLMARYGAPSWYITISPADVKHPICLYFADTDEVFSPDLRPYDERIRLIASNPVAGARFFHYMVELFIKHVLGVGANHPGLYGDTSAYYGTVEQQGRLTLHLHLLLWICNSLSPQETRDRILDIKSDFRQRLIDYLEAVHIGEFLTGTHAEVFEKVSEASTSGTYVDPTQTLPSPPPQTCHSRCAKCSKCLSHGLWQQKYRAEVDDLILKSNVHHCSDATSGDKTGKKQRYVGCVDVKTGKCKARFPRQVFPQTEVDPESGAVNMRKLEPRINTLSPALTYLMRCNTDVTSLKSGTAIKAVIMYVTDYITKSSLKTHVMFDIVRSTYLKNSMLIGGSETRHEKARKLMTKMVNNISAKLEMGSPMVCMYLLKNPDHYTNCEFAPCYWKHFVHEARRPWNPEDTDNNAECEKVTLIKRKGCILGLSPVHDYVYRPSELDNMCLYDWVSRCTREKVRRCAKSKQLVFPYIGSDESESTYESGYEATDKSDSDTADSPCQLTKKYIPAQTSIQEDKQHTNVQYESDKIPAGVYQYLEEHPLHDTHHMRCVAADKALVPNFVGETLPRRDCGDREWYCSAMLTLFCPWRSGLQLKKKEQSWDEAFHLYRFSPQHLRIIDNFNLRYECLDARDDFTSQLKQNPSLVPGWGGFDSRDESGPSTSDTCDDISGVITEDIDSNMDVIGKRESKRRHEMSIMNDIMKSSGWTEAIQKQPTTIMQTPEFVKTGAQWKAEVKQQRQAILDKHPDLQIESGPTVTGNPSAVANLCQEYDQVKVVDKSYLDCRLHSTSHKPTIDAIVKDSQLNCEQERAFRIVANHACTPYSEQLKMYLGGMGGTGKTQVVKSLIKFFTVINKSHEFIVLAPTGSAAALLGGSTYHYVFGFSDRPDDNIPNQQLLQLRARFEGVKYIFLDEVSMLSCHDMYRISARLAKVLNVPHLPFGGMNMVFAGDFAQLPPAIGQEHASLYSRTVGRKSTSLRDQAAAIGRALWHQITTVVILRQNMRQRTQTKDDAALRHALSNMRYKDCTPDDIAFLRGRISSTAPNRPCVTQECFRDISIITGLNVHKDEINRIGCLRFAAETSQELTEFFSEDTVGASNKKSIKHGGRSKVNVSTRLNDQIQDALWNQPPSSNNKCIPGKLSLCIGLPIIIRTNTATELCITRGQEGTVHSWQTTKGSKGQLMLDTLFVKLSNPPKTVQFEGLPMNVVPLTRSSVTIECSLPNDEYIIISRSQVEVLPNFAMTDYSSQGKTRPFNVVDLNNCRSHQSYYTALSRSASAAGTCILQGFDVRVVTGGASGALRQEFRELEMLDNITCLRYQGKLPASIIGDQRHIMISKFRDWKGQDYVPAHVHKSIRWGKHSPFHVDIDQSAPSWQILSKNITNSQSGVQPAHDSGTQLLNPSKRKHDLESNNMPSTTHPVKKLKSHHTSMDMQLINMPMPLGTMWQDNSCAYDSVVTLLYFVWSINPIIESDRFKSLGNKILDTLVNSFSTHQLCTWSLEASRDTMRQQLITVAPNAFPWGGYVTVESVYEYLFQTPLCILTSERICRQGHNVTRHLSNLNNSVFSVHHRYTGSAQYWISRLETQLASRCRVCNQLLVQKYQFVTKPCLFVMDTCGAVVRPDVVLQVRINNEICFYDLRGVTYFGNAHFVSRIITPEGQVWYHDGIETGRTTVLEGLVQNCNLQICRTRTPVAYLYVLRPI
jgi:hypothetical protein